MKRSALFLIAAFLCLIAFVRCGSDRSVQDKIPAEKAACEHDVKTTFQTAAGWRPLTDIRSDAVMVYGVGGTFEERLRSWREHGYRTHFMAGIAWGGYQDYFTGKWDGETHFDEGQMDIDGNVIWHNPSVPYIVPTENYLDYFKETCIKRVIDAGVDHVFLEEPEFWAFGGYSDAFKKEWRDYYGFEWRPQHESPENTYLSNKLKYYLYYRALEEVFTYAKEYGKSKGLDVKCYVPTHSLINYSQWQIVSPEASLASLSSLDGYIAQVWTGTSRTPIYLNGEKAERVFETAYLEYSSMESMTAPTGRKMFFLTDPIEDAAHDWADYKKNYEATFTAQLLLPLVSNYEVMPWPDRIYGGLFDTGAGSQEKTRIPRNYSTQMQVMVNALNKMPYSENHVSGSTGITVLTGNSMMFQRFPTHQGYEDPQLSNFFGMALPLVKRGVPVKTAHIENLGFPESLADTRVLLMSYANMKPLDPNAHAILAEWVRRGGIIIYSGRDDDPFQSVREWWNMDSNSFNAPSDHLFSLMGLGAGVGEGTYRYGRGRICVLRHDPKEYVMTEGGDRILLDALRKLYGARLKYKNSFLLHRGIYDVASVMTQSVSDDPMVLKGKLIDLYDPELPVCERKVIMPGQQALLVNVGRIPDPGKPQVLAAAARESDEIRKEGFYSMVFKSPVNTTNVARVLLPSMPVSVKIDGVEAFSESDWHASSRTYRLNFENSPDGVRVEIRY